MKIYSAFEGELLEVELYELVFTSNNFYWIIANSGELDNLTDKFDLKEETIEECLNKRQDPKVDIYSEYSFCVFNEINLSENKLKFEKLNLYYSQNFIITVAKENSEIIGSILKQLVEKDSKLLINSSNPCNKVLYLILDGLFVNYFNSFVVLDKKVTGLEEDILKNKTSNFISQFIELRRQILRISKYAMPLTHLINIIQINENNFIDNSMLKYFENIDIKYDKLNSNVTSLRESISYLREAYEAEASNQTNKIMKIFTIVSSVFLPLSLLTGIFGMNFIYIPMIDRERGFFELMALMLVLVICLILLFRKKGWI